MLDRVCCFQLPAAHANACSCLLLSTPGCSCQRLLISALFYSRLLMPTPTHCLLLSTPGCSCPRLLMSAPSCSYLIVPFPDWSAWSCLYTCLLLLMLSQACSYLLPAPCCSVLHEPTHVCSFSSCLLISLNSCSYLLPPTLSYFCLFMSVQCPCHAQRKAVVMFKCKLFACFFNLPFSFGNAHWNTSHNFLLCHWLIC